LYGLGKGLGKAGQLMKDIWNKDNLIIKLVDIFFEPSDSPHSAPVVSLTFTCRMYKNNIEHR